MRITRKTLALAIVAASRPATSTLVQAKHKKTPAAIATPMPAPTGTTTPDPMPTPPVPPSGDPSAPKPM
jgi:hypothetical protein